MNLNDQILQLIFEKLPLLRTLKLYSSEITDNAFIGQSPISNLRGLRSLSLRDVPIVTEALITKSFQFPELSTLDLSGFRGTLSTKFMKTLVNGCPVIEELNLSGVRSLTDDYILIVAEDLWRLKMLNVRDCTNLTPNSWKYLANSCRQLEVLDCKDCEFYESSRDMLFEKVRTLKYIHYSSHKDPYKKEIR